MRRTHGTVTLAVVLLFALVGCTQAPGVTGSASGGAGPAVEASTGSTAQSSTADATPPASPDVALVAASGPVYTPAKGGPKDSERAAILAAAHLYLSEKSDFVVLQLLVQRPYAIAELQATGNGQVRMVAIGLSGGAWEGLWSASPGVAAAKDLEKAAVLDAPGLVDVFDWQGTPSKSVLAKILKPLVLSAGGVVNKLTVKVIAHDGDGTLWAGFVVTNDIDGGLGFARRKLGKKWEIVEFGTGIDSSDLKGKASSTIIKAMHDAGF